MKSEYQNSRAVELYQKVTGCSKVTAKREVSNFIESAEGDLADCKAKYIPLEEAIRQIG